MKPDTRRDALGRRPRDRRISTGKRVTPQERDLIWFQKLHDHGPLSSSYLHAFTKHLRSSEKRARDRLTDLFNESNTPHSGAYLERPWQQFQTYDARYQELVYDLAPAGEKALKQAGQWHTNGHVASGPWVHKYMVACITASIELETLEDPGLTYIPGSAILERAGTTLRYEVPFINPVTGYEQTVDLIPDALFGLEYIKQGKKSYRFFLVEADRGNEPSRSYRFNRKSHMRNFLQYREYVGRGRYKEHLGLTAGMLVLNVANSEATMNRMLELIQEISPRGNSYMLFQAVDGFGRYFKPSSSHSALCKAQWKRVGARPMVISVI